MRSRATRGWPVGWPTGVALLVLASLPGCASEAGPGCSRPVSSDCLARHHEAVAAYAGDVKRAVVAVWVVPAGTQPGAHAAIRFRLARTGEVLSHEVVEASTPELGASADAALVAAAPFGPMPDEIAFLAGASLIGRFVAEDAGGGKAP